MVFDLATRRAALSPERPAVWADGRWYTYLELEERATALAARLAEAGVTKGDRVGIVASNHLAHLDLLLSTPKLGFIHTPFNYRLTERELRDLGALTTPALVLFDEANADRAAAVAGEHGALLALDGYEEWLASAPAAPEAPQLSPEDPQLMLFTGGTTGTSKGALQPYRQGFHNAVNTVFSWGLRPEDCVIQATPCFHAAVNALTVPLLHLGARVVLQPAFEAGEYLELLEEHEATIMFLVPTMFGMLTRHERFRDSDLSSVRWAISGGAPCTDAVRAAFTERGVAFRQGYGLTEAGVNCFAIDLAAAREKPQSVGRPILLSQAVIRAADGTPVEQGETGELTLRGPHVFSGYWQDEAATAQVLRDGWLWTGDLARQDADGDYFLVGRRKDMFISGGENVFPAEIENVLSNHPAVAECVVMGVPDEDWGEVGLAAVVLHQPGTVTGEQLADYLRQHLARYKVPKRFLFRNSLPKSGAGKILTRQLTEEHPEAA